MTGWLSKKIPGRANRFLSAVAKEMQDSRRVSNRRCRFKQDIHLAVTCVQLPVHIDGELLPKEADDDIDENEGKRLLMLEKGENMGGEGKD